MSSTGRSDARKGHEFDYYKTPEWIIEEFIAKLHDMQNVFGESLFDSFCSISANGLLDPCAGGRVWSGQLIEPMAYPSALHKHGIHADTMDIREDSPAEIHGDFLNTDLDRKYGVVISNPPFTLAQEFVTKALECTVHHGYVVMLLRIGFFGSAKRKRWFEANMPEFTILHHKRPSFSNDGKTDSDYYAHFVWRKGYHPTESRLILV